MTTATTRARNGSTRVKQRRQLEPALTRLAQQINEAHLDAERHIHSSLERARRAGTLLNEVKHLLPHGEFMPWVERSCAFSQPTANLYMKLAREWDRLGNSQRVRNLSLREAAHVLYESDDLPQMRGAVPPTPQQASDLVDAGLLEPAELDGLSPVQAHTLIVEVREADLTFCHESWVERIAKTTDVTERRTLEEGMKRHLMDRVLLRLWVREAVNQLHAGTITHLAIRGLVRMDLRFQRLLSARKGEDGTALGRLVKALVALREAADDIHAFSHELPDTWRLSLLWWDSFSIRVEGQRLIVESSGKEWMK